MKASIYTQYGSPEVLQIKEVDKPSPGDNELLVRVHSATVNRTDCAMLRAKPFIMRFFMGLRKPRNPILGTDFAGEVEAIGKKITSYKVGDKVFGFDDGGVSSHALYMTIAESKAIALMPTISYEQAAASLEGAHYAYNFINKVDLKKGQKVLVNGASGAIGSAAVQLAVYFGAMVTAVCKTENFELMKSLGATSLIDYTREDFTKSNNKYHYVFDTVGKSTFSKCKPVLVPDGVYISSELGPGGENVYLPLLTKMRGGKKVKFPIPLDKPASVLLIKRLIEEGKFNAVIDRKYPLEQIAEAFRYVETGEKIGNVVLTIG